MDYLESHGIFGVLFRYEYDFSLRVAKTSNPKPNCYILPDPGDCACLVRITTANSATDFLFSMVFV